MSANACQCCVQVELEEVYPDSQRDPQTFKRGRVKKFSLYEQMRVQGGVELRCLRTPVSVVCMCNPIV